MYGINIYMWKNALREMTSDEAKESIVNNNS